MNATMITAPAAAKRRRLNPRSLSDAQIAFAEYVDANLFGQDAGKDLLKQAYTNFLNPLRDKKKPIGFMILAGESRSGKTETARLIPRFVHGNDEALLKINCSEYMDKYKLSNLTGSPRGYIGNQTAGDDKYDKVPVDKKHGYAEFMNHNLIWSRKGSEVPITVVLLDEWEKACYELNLLLLQIMDDGFMTLGSGEVVDFRNCLFIATTNIGMGEVENEEKGGIGFNARAKKLDGGEVEKIVLEQIRKSTPPEFRNRVKELGGIAMYTRLDTPQMRLVLDRDVQQLQNEISAAGYHFVISVTDAAKDEMLRLALENNGNLSNLKNVITTHLRANLGTEAIKRAIKPGDYVIVDVEANPDAANTLMFVFDLGDALGLDLGGGSSSSGEAKSSVTTDGAPADDVEPAVYQIGSLLGLRSPGVFMVAMGKGVKNGTGFLLADQLASVGLMPQLPAVFTDVHNMTMLNKAAALKAEAKSYPALMCEYVIELKEEEHYLALAERANTVVQELTNLLGVEVLQTNFVHNKPYVFTALVKALPASMGYAQIRFDKMVIRPVEAKKQ
jgi:hypothetical protein